MNNMIQNIQGHIQRDDVLLNKRNHVTTTTRRSQRGRVFSLFFVFFVSLWCVSLCLPLTAGAEGSTCAEVKIEIAQELTLERQAFEAHMRIHNGLSHITLENISVVVNFLDEEGNPVGASSDPDSTTATFFIQLDSTENVGNLQIDPNNLDFTGTVNPSSSADMYWLIIPAPGASDGNPQGKLYYVGATLTYTIGGEEHVTEVTPDYIFVKPMPELHLDYFLPNEVYGDDAFTTEIIESPVPFSLGVRVSNLGFGTAWNLKIDSAQPKITEDGNPQGLLIDFLITGSEVNGQPATESLLVDFGTIAPDTAGVARWIMTCSLSGQFVEFSADFSHADELGGQLTSLIEEVNTHVLVHDVVVDLPGRDSIRDFLATDDPESGLYTVYESENTETEVTDQSAFSTLSGSGTTYTLTVPVTPGFLYVHLPISETLGTGGQVSALRSDGKQITPENVWISKSRKSNPEDGWDYFVNLFDANTTDTYTLVFEGAEAQPPVLAFIPNQTGMETQPITFLVEASCGQGLPCTPMLSATPLPVGASFTDHGDGSGTFDWTPVSGQAGTYAITVEASDGELTDSQSVTIIVTPDAGYMITASAGTGGTISPSGVVVVAEGADQALTITADTGYHIADVLVDGVSGGAVSAYLFTDVSANHTIEVVFALDTYTITATAGPNGSIIPSGAVTVEYGTDQRFTITPDAGYHIIDVRVDGESVDYDGFSDEHNFVIGGTVTLTNIDADHTLEADFAIKTYTILATAGVGGSISPSGELPVDHGADQSVTITPDAGYHIADILVDGISVGAVNAYTVSHVTAPHSIQALFASGTHTHTITATAGAHGSILPIGTVTVEDGTDQNFTITAESGYHIADVLVDGVSIGAVSTYTFSNVTDDHTIEAMFASDITTFTITATAGANGSITPIGDVTVEHGADQGFTITADAGYHIADVLVDGTSVGAVGSYTFSNVTADHTIEASFAINTYTITATTGTNGSITPVGDVTVEHGTDQGFTITPDAGYHIADVVVDGTSVGAVSTYTFSNVTADHTIEASFAINTYTITATAGTNGSITSVGDVTVDHGAEQGFTITPDAGYHIADVVVDGTSVGAVSSYTFSNVTADHTIEASFAINTYTITATAGTNGSITPIGDVTVEHGAEQSFTITPNEGYHIADVLVDGTSVGSISSYTFSNVTADHTIEASFAINTYTITATAGTNGSIEPSGAITVEHGTEQSFTITPDAGYHIADVLVDGMSVGAVSSYTFSTVTADHTIEASFAINTYTITATAGTNGSITPIGDVTVDHGAEQSFTITPDAGYHIADVLVDGTSVGAVSSYTFSTVTADHTIEASFAINTSTITATAGTNGSITPIGDVTVEHGADQGFTITPNEGYHIADVLVDGTSVGAVSSYTFSNVTADHTIEASFAINTYTITATTGTNGSIEPSGAITVEHGAEQSFTITPNEGYHIADVLVDGTSVGAVSSYTFSTVAADHTIEASFAINTYTITATAGTNGSITPIGDVTVKHGVEQSFTITPDTGYFIADVLVDGTSVGSVETYTFSHVSADHTLAATFAWEAAPPEATTLISPSGSLSNCLPTYTWKKVGNARWYSLRVNAPSGWPILLKWYQASEICSGATCLVTSSQPLTDGTYQWQVRTWNWYGIGPVSASLTFSVSGCCGPAPPEPTTLRVPAGQIAEERPTYTWDEAACAEHYLLWVRKTLYSPVLYHWYEASDVCAEGVCSVTPGVTLEPGQYTWQVRTRRSWFFGQWSSPLTFTVAPTTLTLKKRGSGSGTVLVNGQGCAPECQELRIPFTEQTVVNLEAIAAPGSSFVRWENEAGELLEGIVYENTDVTVYAVFENTN